MHYEPPYDRGQIVSFLMDKAVVQATEYTHEGTRITVECDKATVEQAEKALE